MLLRLSCNKEMDLVAKEILNWDSVNLRLIVNSGDMHESNKERLAKERGTDLMGRFLFSITSGRKGMRSQDVETR